MTARAGRTGVSAQAFSFDQGETEIDRRQGGIDRIARIAVEARGDEGGGRAVGLYRRARLAKAQGAGDDDGEPGGDQRAARPIDGRAAAGLP